MKYEDDFDELLNEVLREVRESEPRIGLEGRVLAGVRASSEERRFAWWKWAAVAAMVVLIALGIAVRLGSKVDVVQKEPVKVVVPEKKVAEAKNPREPKQQVKQVRAVAVKSVRAPAKKVEVVAEKAPLLAPTPMTDQERALLLLARNNPEVLDSVRREQRVERREIAPIEIQEIKISGIGEK